MQDKKISISAQLKALSKIGINISYRTYKNFIAGIENIIPSSPAQEKVPENKDKETENKKIVQLNNSGEVKTFAVKNEIKKLGFTRNEKSKAWETEDTEEIINKIKELKVGYGII
jgi:hypothetical protein